VVVADGGGGTGASPRGGDDEGKYTRRASRLRRLLQRFVPSFFAPGLPVVNRCVGVGVGVGVCVCVCVYVLWTTGC